MIGGQLLEYLHRILGDNYSAQFQRDILCSAEYEAYLALAPYQCDAKDVYICIDSVSSSKRLTGTAVCADGAFFIYYSP